MRPNLPMSLLSGMLEGNMSLRCILLEMDRFFVVVVLVEVLCLFVNGSKELNLTFFGSFVVANMSCVCSGASLVIVLSEELRFL